ncbi:YlzJ-like family protein [Halobacillus salinarum]|uniref:YlzJ-like family protein n=1 Tax=Halobacillus salinarum TaxID=2932257 RepID=A0ABY4EH94_9BACI|nr:YlzJ-like family protein [Halobacillus salinarum]UOQ43004.1 YlzJ-like family protein [Halobacillus salinarum]
MIHYTPLSEYDIFPDAGSGKIVYHQHKNKPVKCLDLGNGKMQIIQLLSTDPEDYMDPSLQPGQWLE